MKPAMIVKRQPADYIDHRCPARLKPHAMRLEHRLEFVTAVLTDAIRVEDQSGIQSRASTKLAVTENKAVCIKCRYAPEVGI